MLNEKRFLYALGQEHMARIVTHPYGAALARAKHSL
jgi:hypothetical protein